MIPQICESQCAFWAWSSEPSCHEEWWRELLNGRNFVGPVAMRIAARLKAHQHSRQTIGWLECWGRRG